MSVASCDRKGEIIALSSEITKIIAMANMRKTSRKKKSSIVASASAHAEAVLDFLVGGA